MPPHATMTLDGERRAGASLPVPAALPTVKALKQQILDNGKIPHGEVSLLAESIVELQDARSLAEFERFLTRQIYAIDGGSRLFVKGDFGPAADHEELELHQRLGTAFGVYINPDP